MFIFFPQFHYYERFVYFNIACAGLRHEPTNEVQMANIKKSKGAWAQVSWR